MGGNYRGGNRNNFRGRGGNRGGFRRGGNRNFNDGRGKRDGDKKNFQWQTNERLSEPEAGISQYISEIAGFEGIIKSRYSDFHVNEIDKEGNEAVLSDFSIPEPPEVVIEAGVDYNTELKEFATEEQMKSIQELADNKADPASNVEIDVTDFDKDKRAKFHKALKAVYGKAIFGNTIDRDDKKFIQVKKSSKFDQQRSLGWRWPHEFTYFVMYKENIDTISATAALSHKTGFKPALFTYAGTKDKRGKTSQWISVRKMEPGKIAQAAKAVQGVRVGNFKFLPEALKLGDLKGNRFRIALRSVKGNQEEIEKSLESLRDFGFINYYGLQRFGNCVKIPTYMIGKALLAGNFKEACALIMKERDGEPFYMQKMRKIYAESKDPEKALEVLHSTNTCVEARLLHGLKKHGSTNYLQAMLNLPRNMLMLYTHAYQSFIWNRVASKRREMGLEVVEGDLVYTEDTQQEPVEVAEETSGDIPEETPDENQEPEEVESKYLAMVRPLTAEDIASKNFTVYDIVLPLPGHDIKYPSNEVGEFYSELMAEDNLTSEKLKSKHNVFSLNGAYRKVFVKPENFSWKFMKYSGQNTDLIISDYSKMHKDPEPEDDPKGENLSLILDCVLGPSSYATMALREIMKCDTSVGNQIQKMEENKKAEEDKEKNASEPAVMDTDDKEAVTNDNEETKGEKRSNEDENEDSTDTKKQKVSEEN